MGFNGCAEQRGNTQRDIYATAGELCASKYDVTLNNKIFSSQTMENAFRLSVSSILDNDCKAMKIVWTHLKTGLAFELNLKTNEKR